ncbi:hypothetical protein MMC34_006641 [Xylographa carneopallida]|nr:hypothetical protein [Xylographa carneopallida]
MLAEMQQRIEVSRLTKTFREAMEVTKRLGVRYIWIDSLCIIQDSELGVDWEYESKLMGNVYRHSSCNIAATKSLDGSGGCFTTRHVFDVRPCVVDASWTGSPGTKYTCDSSTQMTHDLKDSMLLNRAWVVQETILAPRTLHFGQHQMYWECLQLTTCETAPARRRFYANKLSLLHESWQNQPLAMFNVADPAFIDYHIWGQVVTKFSHGGLTYPEKDKLIAISSIAKSLAIAAHDSYLAGLWCKPLAQQLRWVCNSVPGQPCLRPETYRAPSWSWASIDGPIIHPSYPYKEQDSAVRIGDARVVPAKMGGDPFGPVVAGYIRLVGTLVKLVYKRASEFEGQGWLGGARCGLIPDEKKFVENTVLCCLPLELGAESVIGLVIELARTARRGEYVRRGYFAVLYNNASTDVLEFKRRFMDACKNKDVRKEVTAADYEALEDDTRDGFPRYRISLV